MLFHLLRIANETKNKYKNYIICINKWNVSKFIIAYDNLLRILQAEQYYLYLRIRKQRKQQIG